jgi:hypothetical protein
MPPLPIGISEMAAEIVRRRRVPPPARPPTDPVSLRQRTNLESLLRRIRQLAEQVVEGRHAESRWEVFLEKGHRFAAVVLAGLGAAGLIVLKTDHVQLQGVSGVAFWGALLALVANIALELYRAFEVGKTALQAKAGARAFAQLKSKVEESLRNDNPLPTLDVLLLVGDGLREIYRDVLGEVPPPEVDVLFREWAEKYHEGWVLTATIQQRR